METYEAPTKKWFSISFKKVANKLTYEINGA